MADLFPYEASLMTNAQENLRVEDDGLVCPEVRWWAESKYRLISLYDELFATGMKNKWDQRVYVDLYAGAGYSHIHGTDVRLKGSPLLALDVSCPFDKYISCLSGFHPHPQHVGCCHSPE
jgi:hypothetical protein